MSNYNTQLQTNNTDLQRVLQALQNKAASDGSGEAAEWSENEDAIITRGISGVYVNNRVMSIGSSAFYYCSNLTSVSFPACKNIGDNAFGYCSKLTSVSFPVCTNIGSSAFQNCRTLSSFTLGASTVCTLSNSNAFNSTPYAGYSSHFSGTPYIYVPASLVSAYKSATNWTYFSSYFIGDESLDQSNGGDSGSDEVILITFTINGVEYQAEEDMTWAEWVTSEYNTINALVYNNYIIALGAPILGVSPTDIIINNTNYIVQNGGGAG